MCKYDNPTKVQARARVVELFKNITGEDSLPATKSYVTIAERSQELPQLLDTGLLSRSQFVGVNRKPSVAQWGRSRFPEATWLTGDFCTTLEQQQLNPGLVYMDSCSLATTRETKEMLVRTMDCCPSGTVVFANVMLNHPYRSPRALTDAETFVEDVFKYAPYLHEEWDAENVQAFRYNASNRTTMLTVGLVKN